MQQRASSMNQKEQQEETSIRQNKQKVKSASRKRKQTAKKTKNLENQEQNNQQKRGKSGQPGRQTHGNNSYSMQTIQDKIPPLIQSANRFRIAMPASRPMDVSGKYWNKISNQITIDTQQLQQKLASQRLAPAQGGNTQRNFNQSQFSNFRGTPQIMTGSNFGQSQNIQLLSNPSEKEIKVKPQLTPLAGNFTKNEIEQFQRPFQFLANVGGKQTSQAQFTTYVDRKLLKKNNQVTTISGQVDTSDINTINITKNTIDLQKVDRTGEKYVKAKVELDQQKTTQITIYTDMNVDRHNFDIKERRILRASSATQRPQNTFRSQKSIPQSGLNNYQAIHDQINKAASALQRPISGVMPVTMSQKVLGNQQIQQTLESEAGNQVKQKDFKISKRPFSANPKYLQIAGFNRPLSAQIKMGQVKQFNKDENKENLVSEDSDEDEDNEDDDIEDQYLDLNIQEEEKIDVRSQQTVETFSHKIMNSRPTTAFKKDKNYELPFPELFDRSERTFAATFAKYGDLSYYTPIQRIGRYMDFSARLKRRHLMDLIAYMKTSKNSIKPAEEEANETELAQQDYMDNCLFIGVMAEEANPRDLEQEQKLNQQVEEEEAKKRVFNPTTFRFEGTFQYEQIWSETLMSQVQLSIYRFQKYIESADAIKNEEVSKYKKEWMSKALDQIPDYLLQQFPSDVKKLFQEVFNNYARAMRQSILEYILRSPDERKRLHIMMLPRPVPTASYKQALQGGYSTEKYAGCHQRKVETENEIKLRLLNNNIVIVSLQSWFRDFRQIYLADFRNLQQFVQESQFQNGQIQAVYSLDYESFWNLQECYRQKTVQLIRNIWYRGCMLIIKRFKFLRFREQQQLMQQGFGASGKWSFQGFQPIADQTRSTVVEHQWDDISKYKKFNKQSKYQRYCMMTSQVHQNVNMVYFQNEEGFDFNSIPEAYFDEKEIEELVDIRENSAYIAFVSMIGGYINYEENGYEILAKEYKRELKYASGNIMKIQLRQLIDRSVDLLLNFFKSFISLDKLKKVVANKPLRIIKPLVTKTQKKALNLEEIHKKKQEEQQSKVSSSLAAQLQKRKQDAQRKQKDQDDDGKEGPQSVFDSEPVLQIPDFMDFQDFFNPIIRLELTLEHSIPSHQLSQSHSFMGLGGNQTVYNIQHGDSLVFNKKEGDMIEEFELYFHRLISSFNDINRPEFSKVRVISKKRYEEDLEEEIRQKKMNIQIKKSTGQFKPQMSSSHIGGVGNLQVPGANSNNLSAINNSNSAGIPNGNVMKAKDFEYFLYKGHEDGQDIYRKFMGRIQIKESDRMTKDLIDENNLGIYTKPYIEKKMRVADIDEQCYQGIKRKIGKIIIRHVKEAKRVVEIFQQFDSVIRGSLQLRVREFLKEERREREYEALLKELRFYLKMSLQLPQLVLFPMFEVGTSIVKDEIQRRLKFLQAEVQKKFESQLVLRSQGICDKYLQICKYLDKSLKTPHDVVDMERYKNNLLLEMGNLQERMFENRKSIFFLLHNDKMFEDETWSLIKELHNWPSKLNTHMDVSDDRHRNERNDIENYVIRRKNNFEKEVLGLDEIIQEVGSWGDLYAYRMIIDKVLDFQNKIDQFEELMNEISQEEMMLFGYKSGFEVFLRVKRYFAPFYELWTNVNEIMVKKRQWMECPLNCIDPDEVDSMIKSSIKILQKLQKHLQENPLAQKVLHTMGQEISDLNEWLPSIEVLCNPSLKPRHWSEIQRIANAKFNHLETSLNEIKYYNIKDYLDQLAEISEKAKKENRLEKMLDKMESEWKDLRFELTSFRDTGIAILQGQNVEEIQVLLDEHTLTAQTVRSSPDVLPMEERAVNWERLMTFLQDTLEVWILVQANYLYLEPIFHSEDITKKLPNEAQEFYKVDRTWREIMRQVQQDTMVLHLKKIKQIQENLEDSHQILEKIQKSLNEYLETKRQYFPRFYFLSNEDLLEILGESKKPQKVQKHLKKCFEGINEVMFRTANSDMMPNSMKQNKKQAKDKQKTEDDFETTADEIIGLISREQEQVDLVKSIYPHEYKGNVECWLLELEKQMKVSMQHVIAESFLDYAKLKDKRAKWLQKWQGQVVLAVSQIYWTQNIENCFSLANNKQKGLQDYFNKCQLMLDEIVNMVRQQLPNLLRLTLGSLIVIDVHSKDVLESLVQDQVSSKDDFSWLSQLRYYFVLQDKNVQAKMITTVQEYGYEYLGNTGRLVITPLTDRCYRTLMSALHLNLGGAPEGPAGTGKTESTKDLAKAIAVHCMVFNCAEGLNAKAMAKFFKGLASAGSWSCFDEFNRIELEVLSVVAQQILEIQRAKNQQKDMFKFEDTEIVLKQSCNIFITMNPGYAGRSELPDNLKALFRPVAMMIPDYTMIAEISLYSFGFLESRNLAKKIVATYRLCSEQLSSQYHYDYGMRAVKAVLTAAKGLKQKFGESEREDMLILRSINDVNLPKFLAQDIPLFQGIIEDLFQGISLKDIQYGSLDVCIKKAIKEMNLQEIKPFIEKVFQLYEMINCRHGLMIVGPPYGAKTCSYKVLAKALTQVTKENPNFGELPVDVILLIIQLIQYYIVNPKSITLSQLYGSFDPISHDFADGILGQIFRKCAYKDVGKSRRWIIFDGPVDAEWIENMNTVLDDNKKLCLMNGEVIMMNDQMNLIFETHDLSYASPATVSRCGMVYLQPENIGWNALLTSWIEILKQKTKGSQGETLDPTLIKRIEDLFEVFFTESYTYLRKKCVTYVPISDVSLASSLMKIFQSLLTNPLFLEFCYNPKMKNEDIINRIDMYYLFSMVWSIGAISDEHSQKNYSQYLRKVAADVYKLKNNKNFKLDKACQIPDGGSTVQNYFIEDHRWVNWKDVLEKQDSTHHFDPSLTYQEIIIPTTENLKHSYILNLCVKNTIPILFVGPTGTGKSVSIQKYLRSLPYELFSTVFVCFSAKTSANQTQEIIDSKLEKRGRKVMGPPLGKKCIIFIDDLNMPQLEKYGAQPPIELLRQWMDHKGWYEHKEKDKNFKELIDLIFVTAMGPPGGGKNPVTPRYLRHFNQIAINNFDENVLMRIFSKLMDWNLKRGNFGVSETSRVLQSVVVGSVDVFLFAQQELRPTPTKSHYLFNLRDLSRVIQGIQMMRKEELQDGKKVLRLWMHEIGRVFGDRLINEEDQLLLFQRVNQVCKEKMKEDLQASLKATFDERKYQLNKDIMTKHLLFGDVLGDGISTHDRNFDEINPKQRNLLTERMNGFLEDFNSVSKKPMNLVLFDFAIMHVLRICRILRMSQGNAFLIGVGGSGRQSLSKLSTFICDFDMVETEQSKNYNIDQWKEDMKRLLLLAGQDNKNSVFLLSDAQIKFGFMLEDINNLLNSGEIPNLFPADEKLQIVEKLRPQAKREGRLDLYNNGTTEQFQDYFIEKTKQHLHIILAMSPIGSLIRERIRNFPSLVNCCTIDWFTVWPEEALEAVADRFLQDESSSEQFESTERISIIRICKKIHTDMISLSNKYREEQKRYNYVTPTSYLELIQTYKTLLNKVRTKTMFLKQGYDKGIEKLLVTAEEVSKMQIDLNEKQPKLEQMTIETDQLMEKIQKESREVVEPKKIQIQEEEAIANQQAQEAQTIKIECDNDLSKALPLVKKAQEALNTIQPSHINEVKSLGKPPGPIKKVLHAVCIMCQRKVEKTPKKDNPKELEENWWYTAQKFMSEKNFMESLLEYDKDHIPETVINKIRDNFLNDPDFRPQRVEQASFAAKGLCMWVRALDQYDRVAKIVAPKKQRAKEAEMKYKETLDGLRLKQNELKLIVDKFELLQQQLDDTARKKQKLQEDIEDCSRKLDRAQTLLQGLGGEQKRWEEQVIFLSKQYRNLTGDILLASAIISYLGAFISIYRNQTIKQWQFDLNSVRLNASDYFSFQQILGEPVTIRHWNLNGLPSDGFSVDNGIIVFNTRRWPLMIDPQTQANKWIKNLESQQQEGHSNVKNKLHIIKLSDPDFVRVIEQCIQLGYPVLIENLGEELDPILEPVLLKQTFKSAGVISINFGDNIIEYSPDFRLYMTTKQPNPHYLPELSTKVTLINFMITFDGLKDQLLNLVVQKENAALDEERQKLIVQSYENKKQLKDIENKILDVLRTSQGNILDDEKAIDVLKQSQTLSLEIKEKQEVAEVTEKKLEEARKLYNPIANHSSLLFFIIQKLSNVDVMYQYSLSWFIQLFLFSIENSEKSDFIDQRIESLKEYFTYSLYANVCRSLFEKHKLLFSFILTTKLNEAEGKITDAAYSFLISTQPGLDNCLGLDNPAEDWLPNQTWNRLSELSKVDSGFTTLIKNFTSNSKIWKKIFESNNPMKEIFPMIKNESSDNLQDMNLFEKMCILKVLRPDKIIPAAKEYVVQQKGEQFVNPPPFDLDLSFNDSTFFTPLIFVLPGADPLQSLTAFATIKKKLETMKSISLGQDQGTKAEKAIEEAKIKGGWVLLQNCHLYPSWMPKLERICEQLEMKVGGKDAAHPSFRLWLTSYPSKDFPISILQNGIKMTNEPPKGLKANMLGSYKLEPISDPAFLNIHPRPETFKKLLYGLCMFHAIIQERRNYGPLGWNIRYEFTVSDLQISAKQLHLFVGEYSNVPFKALKYLTGECNYGGRVTDDRDRRVLKSLLEDFYNENLLKESFFAFGINDFEIPHGNLHQNKYLESIYKMPLDEPPSLFGFHPNANITKDLKETDELCYDLIKMGEIEGVKSQMKQNIKNQGKGQQQLQRKATKDLDQQKKDTGINSKPEQIIEKACKDILSKLPQVFDLEQIQAKFPVLRENSMNTVLVQELTRFNQLLKIIQSSLKNILLALKGEVLLSEQLERVYNSLLIGEIPQMWLKASYPSLKPVASYIKDFCNRLATFQQWINQGPPNVFWISGFFFTQSFLTGILQNYARRYKVEIDTLIFDFQFLEEDPTDYENEIYMNEKTKLKVPEDGAYISGLYFEGARWDYQQGCLAESMPKILFSKVPIIWLKPIRSSKVSSKDSYECPMYKTAERKGTLLTTGHSTNFILNVRTPIKDEVAEHWIKRGVAMLCQLSN